jgi:hypothetical protein
VRSQVARKWEFLQRKAQFYKLEVAEEIDNANMSDLATLLAKRGYQVISRGYQVISRGYQVISRGYQFFHYY